MPNIGSAELVIILLLILVLFGAKRLPGAARSLGQSMRIFKAETKGLRSDSDTDIEPTGVSKAEPTPPGTPVAPSTPATPATEQQRPPQQ